MKKNSRILLVVSLVLLGMNIIYVVDRLQTMNVLQFLGFTIFFPCIYISFIISGLIVEANLQDVKLQMMVSAILGGIVTVFAGIVAGQNQNYIEKIVENTKRITETSILSISDISINNGVSSYVFIFILIFTCSMSVNVLFNIYRRRAEHVSK